MFAGWVELEITEKNAMGGGLVKVVDPLWYTGTVVGFSKFDGFKDDAIGTRVHGFLEVGHFKSVRREDK